MDKQYYEELMQVRIVRAQELLEESKDLLSKEAYKSANNRAFYAIEKSLKALLASVQTDAETHNGAVKLFNYHFVHQGNGTFTVDDYKMIVKADQIRNASDYDDFYIASKEETRIQVENADYIVNKVMKFLQK
jgi:uncharacterized protein (UPF0332 family)